MKELDQIIRTTINKHVKGVHLQVDLFYTHWKDGGFSFQPLHDRALELRAKTFMDLCNSNSEKVRNSMRFFVVSEQEFRNIDTCNENEDTIFLNWKLPEKIESGTDTITLHALRTAQKLNFCLEVNQETEMLKLYSNLTNHLL